MQNHLSAMATLAAQREAEKQATVERVIREHQVAKEAEERRKKVALVV